MNELILASSSPRRRELLTKAGINFRIVSPDIAEELQPGEAPVDFCRRLAREKGEAALIKCEGAVRVLAADTIVAVGGEVLGKPKDDEDAWRMLRLLSGRAHEVATGVCLLTRDEQGRVTADVRHEMSEVFFRPLQDSEIAAYIASGEPHDRAGSYAIQGGAAKFVERYEGDYNNVVGLPVLLVLEMLKGR